MAILYTNFIRKSRGFGKNFKFFLNNKCKLSYRKNCAPKYISEFWLDGWSKLFYWDKSDILLINIADQTSRRAAFNKRMLIFWIKELCIVIPQILVNDRKPILIVH